MTARQKFAIHVAIAPQFFMSPADVRRMAGGVQQSLSSEGRLLRISRPSLPGLEKYYVLKYG